MTPEAQKQAAITYFRQHDLKQHVFDFWTRHSPIPLSVGIQLAHKHPLAEFQQNWRGILQHDPEMRGRRGHNRFLTTISGPVFEYLAYAYLKTTETPQGIEHLEIGSRFEAISELLEEDELAITDPHPGIFFSGDRLQSKGKTLVSPDGIVLTTHPSQEGFQIVKGFYDCNMRSETKVIEPNQHFVELLWEYPRSFEKFKQGVLDNRDVIMPEEIVPEEIELYQIVRRDFSNKEKQKAEAMGWRVIETPFDMTDITQQTMLILPSYLNRVIGLKEDEAIEAINNRASTSPTV